MLHRRIGYRPFAAPPDRVPNEDVVPQTCIRLLGIALAAAVSGCANPSPRLSTDQAVAPEGDRGPFIVNDRDLMTTFETAAGARCDSAAQPTMRELEAELDRPPAVPPGEWPAARSAARPLSEIYARRVRGVMLVMRMYKCERCTHWHMNAEGTAFLVRGDGLAVTCRHVLETDGPENADDVLLCGDCAGRVYPVRQVVASSRGCDIAIVMLDMGAARTLSAAERPMPIPLRIDAIVGEPISVISHPHHNHYMLTRGVVSRLGTKYNGINGDLKSMKDISVPFINVTAEYGVGSSGAPVLDDAGNAIGVVVSTFGVASETDKRPDDVQMVIRFCAPAAVLHELIEHSPAATQ